MGVWVRSQGAGFDTGYLTFNRLRLEIAALLGDEWREHYEKMFYLYTKEDFESYDAKTAGLAESCGPDEEMVLDFLYATDCGGELDAEHCRAIVQLMDCKSSMWAGDMRSWSYACHDAFTLADFQRLLEDGWKSGDGIEWS